MWPNATLTEYGVLLHMHMHRPHVQVGSLPLTHIAYHSTSINLQVGFNKILRRIWNLPFNSHTKIVHCVSRIESIGNLIYKRFIRLYQKALSSSSLVQGIFSFSSSHWNCGTSHLTEYSEADIEISDWICLVRHNFGNYSDIEDFVRTVSAV